MKCSLRPPLISARDAQAIADAMAANRRGYTPEWRAERQSGDAGMAVGDIFARYLEIQGDGLNAMPLRLQLEFLESLGANVLAAQPARTPLVFRLLDTASGDAAVPRGTRIAAVLPPPAPSLDSDASPTPPLAPEFFTEQDFTAMRGTLAAVYSVDPLADTYADHSAATPGSFAVLNATLQVPHRLYLGHAELFNFKGPAEIVLSFVLASRGSSADAPPPRPLLLDWEYLSADGWQPLVLTQDTTLRFTRTGKITLTKLFGPDSKQDVIRDQNSCWIRASVASGTPNARISDEPAGYLIRFTPTGAAALNAGDTVGILGASGGSRALAVGEGHIIVDVPLTGSVPGAKLTNSQAVVIGDVFSAPPYFRLAVDTSVDLLPGDLITLDGTQRATVMQTDDRSLYLSAPFTGVQPSLTVELADALPPLRPDGSDQAGVLPLVDVIRARVGLGADDLPLDSAYLDGFKVDVSKNFRPFGEQPERYAAFYLACKDAFSRRGARITLHIAYSEPGTTAGNAWIETEYFNGQRWVPVGAQQEYKDASVNLTQFEVPGSFKATMSFVVPADWSETELNGEKQIWLRLRLAVGDYGRPMGLSVVPDPNDPSKTIVNATPSTLKAPVLARLTVSFRCLTDARALDSCLCENDFVLTDHSEEARWPCSPFAPFTPVLDRTPALHLGFSSKPPAAAVSVLAHVIEAPADGAPQPYVWDYWGTRGWTELSVRDGTLGLTQTGIIQFVGASDAVPRDGLGGSLYRVRARLKSGLSGQDQIVRCGGFWLNAAWARQGQLIDRDGLGISNGNPDQTFALPMVRASKAVPLGETAAGQTPIALNATDFERALDMPLAGVPIVSDEIVEVREWAGRGDDWQTLLGDVDPALIRFEVDPQDPTVKTAAWVRWQAQPHFYRSGPKDRHYVVERARGIFRFPGADGFIPPAGSPIVASYVTGGSTDGNVPAGKVSELRSGVGFLQSVGNPMPASGGAAAELLHDARDRSTQTVRNRDRAVSFEDYEWLALSASSELARVRALPLEGPAGRGARGFVGIVLVPHSTEAMPQPSPQLCSTVLTALRQRAPAGIAGGIRIITPSYLAAGVRAEILPLRAEEAGRVEARVRTRLNKFLHPLTGGRDGRGWDFGESVYLSDLAALLEDIPGVDAVRFLQLMTGNAVYGDALPVQPHELIAAGDSQLKIIIPSASYALA